MRNCEGLSGDKKQWVENKKNKITKFNKNQQKMVIEEF